MGSSSASGNRVWRNRSLRRGLCCCFFSLTLAWAPAHGATEEAGDDSLLDKLHQKQILTDEEYEELKREEENGDDSLLEKLHQKRILTDEEYQELKREEENGDESEEREKRLGKLLKYLEGLQIGTLSYVDFSGGERNDGNSFNRFTITRGYINIKWRLTPWLGFRITPDAHQDASGDFELRLKYLYAEFRPPDLCFFTDMKSEVGIGHMPWLDFEEHINPYRVQGTMFIERARTFNSADVGVSLRGLFGGQLDSEYQDEVSHYYPGRWGSWHFGVYNGGGYHANERNDNKIPEWRISLRPIPDLLPGLQVHYFGLYGKGNRENVSEFPDYRVNLAMLSYQNQWITFTGQYARTRGNNSGSLVVPGTDDALRGEGYSFFFNTKLPLCDRKLSAFARYDHFDPDRTNRVTAGDDSYHLANAGLAWEFFGHWMLLLAYERIMYEDNNGGLGAVPGPNMNLAHDWRVQTALQIKF
jgi:hypothetical protein